MTDEKTFFLLSDATGETAETIVEAALTQFQSEVVHVRRVSNIRTQKQLFELLPEAAACNALVFFTFVDRELATFTERECAALGLECLDLISPLLHKMARYFGHLPVGTPGLLHEVGEEYYQRVEAMEFALKFDDGQNPTGLSAADIILVGVSRTSKTPLSIYLSCRGWKVANVPLVKGIAIPAELERINPKRVVGLFIDAQRLIERRSARLQNIGETPLTEYTDYEEVRDELRWARALCRKYGWETVNVSGRSIEENAHEILVALKLK